MTYVGIDVSKLTFVVLIRLQRLVKPKPLRILLKVFVSL